MELVTCINAKVICNKVFGGPVTITAYLASSIGCRFKHIFTARHSISTRVYFIDIG